MIDTNLNRGEVVTYWVMARILEKQGKGDYPNEIPRIYGPKTAYGQVTPNIDRTTLSPAQKAEILNKFNALVEERGGEDVTRMIMEARKEQHRFDAAALPEREKFIAGWFNRIDDLPKNNPTFTQQDVEAWRATQRSAAPQPVPTTTAVVPQPAPSQQPAATAPDAAPKFDLGSLWKMIQELIAQIFAPSQPQATHNPAPTPIAQPTTSASPSYAVTPTATPTLASPDQSRLFYRA
ncbi:MAG: hypothetical protein EAY76_05705 [Alphaproteobacteria bacterium]|nr:MAG: hypothetical protein EAY76_05705 [Alphaproteobacteria bacterium]